MNSEWDEFTEASFDSPDCKCSQLDNHAHCKIHGVPPWGGQLADKHKTPEAECPVLPVPPRVEPPHPVKVCEKHEVSFWNLKDCDICRWLARASSPAVAPAENIQEELAKCQKSNWENRRRADAAEGELERLKAAPAVAGRTQGDAREWLASRGLADLSLYWPTNKPIPQIDYASGEAKPTLTQLMDEFAGRESAGEALSKEKG